MDKIIKFGQKGYNKGQLNPNYRNYNLKKDKSGQRINRLLIIKRDLSKLQNRVYYICKCDCGKYCSVNSSNLKLGKQESCGCLREERKIARQLGKRRPEISGENHPCKRVEVREKISKSRLGIVSPNKGKKFSLKTKNKISNSNKGRKLSEEHKKNLSLAKLGKPRSDKQNKAILATLCKFPNKFEQNCSSVLNQKYPNLFRYVGDGTLLINHKSPDFFSEKINTVVLCHGTYWHLGVYNIKDTLENRICVELKDSLPFLKQGYDVWFIWEDNYNIITKYKSNKGQ